MKEKASLALLVRFLYLPRWKFSRQLISYTEVNSQGWLECKDQYKHYSRQLNDHLLRLLCYWVVPKRVEIQAGAKRKKIDGTRKISFSGPHNINRLLTERESRTGESILARGRGSEDWMQPSPHCHDRASSVSKLFIMWHSISGSEMHCLFQFLHEESPELQDNRTRSENKN